MDGKIGPHNPDYEHDVSKHFVGKDGKIFEDPSAPFPDLEKEIGDRREKLEEKYSTLKKIIIELGKLKLGVKEMQILKVIGGLIGLIIAFVFVFAIPGAGFELLVVGAVGAIFNALGYTSWRLDYGVIKEWYASKTIWGALMVVMPIIALLAINVFALGLPAWVVTVLHTLIIAGGGTQIWGIFSAVSKAGKTETFIK